MESTTNLQDFVSSISTENVQPLASESTENVEPKAEESKVEEPKVEEKKEDSFSKKFTALSKKEKALRQKELEIEKRLQELEAQKPKEEKKVEVPLEQRFKRDPLNTLKELGLSFEDLTEIFLNDGKMNPDRKIELLKEEINAKHRQELDELKAEMARKEEETKKLEIDRALNAYKRNIENFCSTKPDQYELICADKAYDLVFEVIDAHYTETGNELSMEEAANAVESHLFEEKQKYLKLKKFSNMLKSEPTSQKKPEVKSGKPTLTNDLNAVSVQADDKPMSNEDYFNAAVKTLRFTD